MADETLAALLNKQVLILHLNLLLTYCQRYVNRQFLTRKPASHALLNKVELLLNQHFAEQEGLPTVVRSATCRRSTSATAS